MPKEGSFAGGLTGMKNPYGFDKATNSDTLIA